MILIIGSLADPHVSRVIENINCAAENVKVIDIYGGRGSAHEIALSGQMNIRINGHHKKDSEPNLIWWRFKPPFVIKNNSIEAYYNQQFLIREWLSVFDFFKHHYAKVRWVNNHHCSNLPSNKIYQLECAKEVGFLVPDTLITNDPVELRAFESKCRPNKVVHKTFSPYISPEGRMKYTTILEDDWEEYSDSVTACPSIYQECIISKEELRVTVIGESIHAVSINKADKSSPDWRQEMDDDIYCHTNLSKSMAERIIALHQSLSLDIGAYDFIIDKDGYEYFIEVNPSGQWIWLEDKLGLSITRELAHYMVQMDLPVVHSDSGYEANRPENPFAISIDYPKK